MAFKKLTIFVLLCAVGASATQLRGRVRGGLTVKPEVKTSMNEGGGTEDEEKCPMCDGVDEAKCKDHQKGKHTDEELSACDKCFKCHQDEEHDEFMEHHNKAYDDFMETHLKRNEELAKQHEEEDKKELMKKNAKVDIQMKQYEEEDAKLREFMKHHEEYYEEFMTHQHDQAKEHSEYMKHQEQQNKAGK
jgi:hypothetical protein